MTDQEMQARYDALTETEREAFHVKLTEYAATLLNPNQGPYDNAHWHKVPPSPIVVSSTETEVAAIPGMTPGVSVPAPAVAPVAKPSFWGWNKR